MINSCPGKITVASNIITTVTQPAINEWVEMRQEALQTFINQASRNRLLNSRCLSPLNRKCTFILLRACAPTGKVAVPSL